MDPRKTLALIPAYTHIDHRLASALGRLDVGCKPILECSDLPKARSQLITYGLERTDAELFLLIDSDMTPSEAQLLALLDSPLLEKQCAVTGAYATRMGTLACRPLNPETAGFELGRPGLEELEATGLGCMAVTRRTLEPVAARLPQLGDAATVAAGRAWRPFAIPFWDGATYYPDDYGFCWRLRDAGGQIWLDTAQLIPHLIREPRIPLPGLVAGPRYVPPAPPPASRPPARTKGKSAPRKASRAKRRQ